MSLPAPYPGLVLRYAYLWRREADAGRLEGVKDRPCVVVVAVRREPGKLLVAFAPITHAPPRSSAEGIELPPPVKQRLGLDQERAWVVVTELNVFDWPGHDLRPIDPRNALRGFAYGSLPNRLARTVIETMRRKMHEGGLSTIARKG